MKKGILFACTIAALIALPAGCGKANSGSAASGQSAQASAGTMGVITQISGNSITIAMMPNGGSNGNQPQASGAPQGGQGPGGQNPGGQAGSPPGAMPAQDTSSWQKETFVIDSSTKIVQGRMPGSTSTQSSSLTVSDLKTGESVSVTGRSGTSGNTADQITVMQGMGGMPGVQGGPAGSGAPAPQPTANS